MSFDKVNFDKVILRCFIENEVMDGFVDVLLAYPEQDLKIVSYPIQTHHLNLHDIQEKVSGFKAQMAFEISLDQDQVEAMLEYLKDHFSYQFEKQLIPLLS